MMRKYLLEVGAVILALIATFEAGRYSAPTRIETKVEYQDRIVEKEVIRWRTRVVRDQHEYKTVVEHKFPDGTLVRKSTDEKDSETKRETTEDKKDKRQEDQHETQTTIVIREHANWRIGALVGGRLELPYVPSFGARVEHRAFGPFWLGLDVYPSTRIVGASLSLEF